MHEDSPLQRQTGVPGGPAVEQKLTADVAECAETSFYPIFLCVLRDLCGSRFLIWTCVRYPHLSAARSFPTPASDRGPRRARGGTKANRRGRRVRRDKLLPDFSLRAPRSLRFQVFDLDVRAVFSPLRCTKIPHSSGRPGSPAGPRWNKS